MSEPNCRDREVSEAARNSWTRAERVVLIATYREQCVAAETERVRCIVEQLIERFEHVATFKDGTQERVVYAAALEVELARALRGET